MAWQIQEAKQRFSLLVRRARDEGPQTVTHRGEDVAVVVSIDEYRRLSGDRTDFRTFLLSGPDMTGLELERARDLPRGVDL